MLALVLAQLRKYWPEAAGGALLLAVTVWWGYCRPHPVPVPVAEQHSLDSLELTAPIFQQHEQALVKRETVYVARAAHEEHAAATARHAADSLSVVADTLRAVPRTDTVSQVLRQEADSLRSSNDSLRAANTALDSAWVASDARAVAALARMAAVESLNARLAKDIQSAGQCHVVFSFISCPSRRASFVVGGILATGATLSVWRR